MVNIGAGTGSYEPTDRWVVAVEPSAVMLAQRPSGAAPAVRAVAEHLPLPDGAADVGMAVLTLHHWSDWRAGLAELRRVARRLVIVTFDPAVHATTWIVDEYVPEIEELDAGRIPYRPLVEALDATVTDLPLTREFTDGLLGAYWCRPEAYLDPAVRSHMSGFVQVDPEVVGRAMSRLGADLASGAWADRHRHLATLDSYDAGFRLLVAEVGGPGS